MDQFYYEAEVDDKPESNAMSVDNGGHYADGEYDLVMTSTLLRAVFFSLYAVIFVVGVSGNSLVILVVWRNKSLQTITNIFITNLAASDILMCLLAIPFTPISGLLTDWIFGKVKLSIS